MRMIRSSGSPAIFFHKRGRVVVLRIDRDQQLVRRQAVFLGDQLPGQLDRQFLEIVAEGEVAEHLEEGVMPRRIPDILQVVMLTAGAHAFLRRGRTVVIALLRAGEDVLELNHPGVGEHQRGIVARHQRRRVDHFMAMLPEILQEGGSDFVRCAHCFHITRGKRLKAHPISDIPPVGAAGRQRLYPALQGLSSNPTGGKTPQRNR